MLRLRIGVRGPRGCTRLAAVLVVLGLGAPAAPAQTAEIDAEAIVHLLQGQKNYRTHCAPCHGRDGIATLTYAPGFRSGVAVLTDEYILTLLETGGFKMPPWGHVLTQEERIDIVTFVRHLSGGPLERQPCAHCHGASAGEDALPLLYPF